MREADQKERNKACFKFLKGRGEGPRSGYVLMPTEIWDAACAWQIQKDVEACKEYRKSEDCLGPDYWQGSLAVQERILEQLGE